MPVNGATVEIDKGFKRLVDDLRQNVKGSFVDVGIFGGTSPSGESVLMYAVVNEFGSEKEYTKTATGKSIFGKLFTISVTKKVKIPARPFMRKTADDNREKYAAMLADGLDRISAGIDTAKGVLTRVGIKVRGDIKKNIRDGDWEPNAPSTIEQKGSSKPLINTGTMRKFIQFKIGGPAA